MPMTRDQCRQQLLATFQAELACAGRLQTVLAEEADALDSRDVTRIEQLAADKHSVMQEFERLEAQRGRILQDVGFSAEQVTECIRRCDRNGELKRHWDALLEQVRDCQHANRKIGATVEVSRRYVQQALGVLRGQAPEADLYTPKGASNSPFAASRTLGKV